MNRQSNKDRLLSMVQGRDPNMSNRPILYDLTKYGGVHIMLSRKYYSEDELRRMAEEDRRESEERDRELRERHPSLFAK